MAFKKMKRPDIFLSFLKVGLVGFGGGSALIPVVERELLGNRGAMGDGDFLKHTVTANITPGALPVKLGASCGWQLGGAGGGVAGAWGVALPGVLLTVLIMALFRVAGDGAVGYFNAASVGVSAFIIFVLSAYIKKTLRGRRINFLICAAAFALTGGREARSLFALLTGLRPPPSLFDISTISLMALSFFVIFAVECAAQKPPLPLPVLLPLVVLLAGAYAFFSGNYSNTAGWDLPGPVTLVLMALLCLALLWLRKKPARVPAAGISGDGDRGAAGTLGTGDLPPKKQIAVFLALMFLPALACTAAAAVFCPAGDLFAFILQICFSTLSSFGGGEAYISVADGFFVQSGIIQPEIFYTRLVPAANALPGPILIKIAAGVGFAAGFSGGSLPGAVLTAAASAAAALGICGALAVLAVIFYGRLRDSPLAAGLGRYIPPVICGMLLSTSCAMLYESVRIMAAAKLAQAGPIGQTAQIHPWLLLGALVGWVVLLWIIGRFKRVPDPVLLLFSACVSTALCR